MSNRVKKIQNNLELQKRVKVMEMTNSTIGSIVCTFAKLASVSEDTALLLFEGLKDNESFRPNNIKEACDWIKDNLFSDVDFTEMLPYIVLVYDDNSIFNPIVTIYSQDDDILYPVASSGAKFGILSQYDKGNEAVNIEHIYDGAIEVVDECEEE